MNKRVDSLNFIRIIGMTMILLFHAKLMYGFSVETWWMDQVISIGAIFVTVFFMLSGFGLRKSNRELSIRDRHDVFCFYKKRILSIYPLFFLLSAVALVFHFRFMDSLAETLMRLPIQFSMLHILLGKEMHGFLFNDNCWYISALFVLYLLYPFLNELVNRLSVRGKVLLCVSLWIVSVGIFFCCVYCTDFVFLDYYPNPVLRIPEFMIGMMMADLSEEATRKWTLKSSKTNRLLGKECDVIIAIILGAVMLVSSVGLTLLYPHFLFETNLYNVIVIPCTAMTFLCIANWGWLNQLGSKKIVRWLAGLGLEVYLCQSFATLVLSLVKVDADVDEVWFIGLSVVFAVVVNRWFSKPVKKWMR